MSNDDMNSLDEARLEFREELIGAGLLLSSTVPGLYGHAGVFEDVVDGIDRVVQSAGPADAKRLRFPPVFPRASFERTDYVASFPNLTGTINSFSGSDADHAALLTAREAGAEWDEWLTPTETMLVPAACHPAYSTLEPTLPDGGVTLDVYGFCFRHEPAIDPARMQAFRMHEYVYVGGATQAQQHRKYWVDRAMRVLTDDLGLEAASVAANDPFFGRVGRFMAINQRTESLKTELVVRLYGELDEGTAVVSCNYHQDHFGSAFGIQTADGATAHSACVGFGVERIALAMFRKYGTDLLNWPVNVRNRMGL